jgi:NADPH:quinone reductase-like Zn-dependent oxidoreductase
MRAAAIDRFGGPEILTLHVLPVPDVDPAEVLMAVHTAGVGSWDADMRGGWLPDGARPRFPLVLGTDGSGTVAAVGSRVRRFAPGDTVYSYSFANPKGGFYAEGRPRSPGAWPGRPPAKAADADVFRHATPRPRALPRARRVGPACRLTEEIAVRISR